MTLDLHARFFNKPADLGAEAAAALPRLRQEPWHDLSGSPESLLESLGPVSCAMVRGFESRLLGAHIPAPQVAAWCALAPSQLIGAAGIDPTVGQGAKRAEEARALGLQAVSVAPAAAGFDPGQWHAQKLFEACESLKLPVLSEGVEGLWGLCPSAHFEMARPYLWDPVLRRFPALRLVIGGIGNPWVEETLTMLAKHEHAYANLSGLITRPAVLRRALISAEERGVAHKLLFASGYPFSTPAEGVKRILTLGNEYGPSQTTLRALIERDAGALLGLALPAPTASVHPAKESA